MATLLVAATGGHLKQLHLLRDVLEREPDIQGPWQWVTFDKEQSRSLLRSERPASVHFIPFIGSRDLGNTVRGLRTARRLVRRLAPDTVISTGNAVALPYIILGRLRGTRCIYIESAARSDGPSLTGRMVARIPGVELRTQYESWADDRWHFEGSVFDSFVSVPRTPAPRISRVVVALGTLDFDFSRLVSRLTEILPADAQILWQTGGTDVSGLPGEVRSTMPEDELLAAMRDADVVVAHAGVGSALAALDVGKCPVLVPRRTAHSEHVDDHQEQVAAELAKRRLARSVEADEISLDDLHFGMSHRAERRAARSPQARPAASPERRFRRAARTRMAR